MNPVHNAPRDVLHLLPCCWDDARDEIVDVHLQDVPEGAALSAFVDDGVGGSCPVFEFVLWEGSYCGFNIFDRHVPCGFRGGAEVRGGFHPTHLE